MRVRQTFGIPLFDQHIYHARRRAQRHVQGIADFAHRHRARIFFEHRGKPKKGVQLGFADAACAFALEQAQFRARACQVGGQRGEQLSLQSQQLLPNLVHLLCLGAPRVGAGFCFHGDIFPVWKYFSVES